jgi:hypothetical protein
MRVSALRITGAPPPPPDLWVWDGFEDVLETAQRHGSIYYDTGVSGRREYYEPYQLATEEWLDQQNAKNKARALAQYEWNKPENVAVRLAKAKAEWLAQKAAREEYDRVLREQVAEAEAERERQKVLTLAANRQRQLERNQAARDTRAAEAAKAEADAVAAIAFWRGIDPNYAYEPFRACQFTQPMYFRGVTLEPGQGYLLPLSVRGILLKELGYG